MSRLPKILVLVVGGCLAVAAATVAAGEPAAGQTAAAESAAPSGAEQQTAAWTEVYFLLDEDAVWGAGHAALLVGGGGDGGGWHYYSFGPGDLADAPAGNLSHLWFESLDDARGSETLARYDRYLRWASADPPAGGSGAEAARERVAGNWDGADYHPWQHNCYHMVADAVAAAGFEIDADFVRPVAAYEANLPQAHGHGAWPEAPEDAAEADALAAGEDGPSQGEDAPVENAVAAG